MIRHITVSYPSIDRDRGLDLFPIFLNFDFSKMIPRGVLAKIDLLTLGNIYETLDKVSNPKEIVYVLKSGLCFEKGFFLIDFEKFSKEMDRYLTLLKGFEHDCLYFEKNCYIDSELISKELNKIIFVTEFV